ncbi:MAG: hypothetical protein V4659_13695 [Pseudomonadota bacterium]
MRVDHLSDAELMLRPHRVSGPVMDAFLAAQAVHPSRALAYRGPEAAEVARLIADGVLVPVAGGRHWFDLRRHYVVEHARGVRRAMIAVVAALVIAVGAMLFYQG